MNRWQAVRACGAVLASAALPPMPALAAVDETPQLHAMLLHADLPLFGNETEDKWPRSFSDPAARDFGCTSRIAFGDWRVRYTGKEADEDSWYRVTNYGIFHCWANVTEALAQADLDQTKSRPGA